MSLRGVTISSSILNIGMFANSTILKYHNLPTSKQAALDIRDNIYFVLPYLSQRSVVLSQLPLAYLYYLELSLTVFTKYRITAFVNL